MRKVTIHQPEFLPWCGFFDKLNYSDVIIIYDLAQYNKHDFQNRNIVQCNKEFKYIIVPIKKCPTTTLIKDVKIADDIRWKIKINAQLNSYYATTRYFQDIYNLLSIIWEKEWIYLSKLNVELIKKIIDYLGINTEILLSSELIKEEELFTSKSASEKNCILCKIENADIYVSGYCGKGYLCDSLFKKNNIEVEYRKFGKCYDKNMSIIHYMFCYGKDALNMMLES